MIRKLMFVLQQFWIVRRIVSGVWIKTSTSGWIAVDNIKKSETDDSRYFSIQLQDRPSLIHESNKTILEIEG